MKLLSRSRFRAVVAVLAVVGLAMLLTAIGAASSSLHGVVRAFPRSALIFLAALSVGSTLVILVQAGAEPRDP